MVKCYLDEVSQPEVYTVYKLRFLACEQPDARLQGCGYTLCVSKCSRMTESHLCMTSIIYSHAVMQLMAMHYHKVDIVLSMYAMLHVIM